jgi:hypothetical protein
MIWRSTFDDKWLMFSFWTHSAQFTPLNYLMGSPCIYSLSEDFIINGWYLIWIISYVDNTLCGEPVPLSCMQESHAFKGRTSLMWWK